MNLTLSHTKLLNKEKLLTYSAQNKVNQDPVTEADARPADHELDEHVLGHNKFEMDDQTGRADRTLIRKFVIELKPNFRVLSPKLNDK